MGITFTCLFGFLLILFGLATDNDVLVLNNDGHHLHMLVWLAIDFVLASHACLFFAQGNACVLVYNATR